MGLATRRMVSEHTKFLTRLKRRKTPNKKKHNKKKYAVKPQTFLLLTCIMAAPFTSVSMVCSCSIEGPLPPPPPSRLSWFRGTGVRLERFTGSLLVVEDCDCAADAAAIAMAACCAENSV